MVLSFDILGLAGAEYCEHDGVKGVFIPECPNFVYKPQKNRLDKTPSRAIVAVGMYKTKNASQKYDYAGKQNIPPQFKDAYLANPNFVGRQRTVVFGYNWTKGVDETPQSASNAKDFEKLLDD